MTRAAAATVTVLILVGGVTAAFAALERVGSVVLTTVAPGQSEYRNFTGNEVSLTARNSDINCDSVVATFDNGLSRGIFSGDLQRGHQITVGIPERQGRVVRMDFNCKPNGGLGGVIDIAAGTNVMFANRNAAQLAEVTPDRGGWRDFFAHLF
ncbi:MAG: hypothetical protein KGO48_00940 [Alphaproteobacteria bacterium]|nr:hypothetical protein [Alphaproteobacteria bacterium]